MKKSLLGIIAAGILGINCAPTIIQCPKPTLPVVEVQTNFSCPTNNIQKYKLVERFSDGQPKRTGICINGRLNGKLVNYYPSGEKAIEYNYVNGWPEGDIVVWTGGSPTTIKDTTLEDETKQLAELSKGYRY